MMTHSTEEPRHAWRRTGVPRVQVTGRGPTTDFLAAELDEARGPVRIPDMVPSGPGGRPGGRRHRHLAGSRRRAEFGTLTIDENTPEETGRSSTPDPPVKQSARHRRPLTRVRSDIQLLSGRRRRKTGEVAVVVLERAWERIWKTALNYSSASLRGSATQNPPWSAKPVPGLRRATFKVKAEAVGRPSLVSNRREPIQFQFGLTLEPRQFSLRWSLACRLLANQSGVPRCNRLFPDESRHYL